LTHSVALISAAKNAPLELKGAFLAGVEFAEGSPGGSARKASQVFCAKPAIQGNLHLNG
jgi:hypothetical protein